MLFSSTTFLFAFLPIVLITYYIVPRITRNLVLFIFSLVFYAWGEPVYIVLMIASTIVAYITGLLADKQRKNEKKYTPLIAMIGAVVWNIGLLLFFKYTDFFIGAANSIFGTQIKALGLALPIGISFYSFQTLSYVIDVYKGEVRSQKNFLDLATYVALFPQLIAGPIVRYIDVAEQLKKRNESIEHFAQETACTTPITNRSSGSGSCRPSSGTSTRFCAGKSRTAERSRAMNDKPSRMDYRQHQAARRLVHECCNYDEGNCLLLDDGEPCVCVQSISLSS